jgi:hypothetical protein
MRLGKKLDKRLYLLNPEILQNSGNPIRYIRNKDIADASSLEHSTLPISGASPSACRKQNRVFVDKRVMLSNNLGIGNHLRGKLEELIQEGGGSVTDNIYCWIEMSRAYQELKDPSR